MGLRSWLLGLIWDEYEEQVEDHEEQVEDHEEH